MSMLTRIVVGAVAIIAAAQVAACQPDSNPPGPVPGTTATPGRRSATRSVDWPAHWERARVRAGRWLAEGHTIQRCTPNAGDWEVFCIRGGRHRIGGGDRLQDAVDALADHLWTCGTQEPATPAHERVAVIPTNPARRKTGETADVR
ncbi:hypothetical protein [Actinosynnema sp. NPDC023587]|uniref:hypothetical protein n=1 Tax=Actinosynnema sp. NPDC023587 TaxID=3154695 RepID=UPI0033E7CBDC